MRGWYRQHCWVGVKNAKDLAKQQKWPKNANISCKSQQTRTRKLKI